MPTCIWASDDQWDTGVASTGMGVVAITLHQGEVYSTAYKWNGTNSSLWNTNGGAFSDMVSDGANLYIGGTAPNVPGLGPRQGVARWDGTNWFPLASGIGVSAYGPWVSALTFYKGHLIVGGSFETAGGVSASSIARWDGTNWWPLGKGLRDALGDDEDTYPGQAHALLTHGDDLYVGGYFGAAGDLSTTGLAKWDGTNWSAVGGGVQGSVRAFAALGNDLIVGGNFSSVGGWLVASNIAKWDGTSWSGLGSGIGPVGSFPCVETLVVHNGILFAGGHFTSAGGVSANNVAEWNGRTWAPLGSGLSGEVYPTAYDSLIWKNDLLLVGSFDIAGSKPSTNFAIWHTLPTLRTVYVSDRIELSWPLSYTGYRLESSPCLDSGNWDTISPPPQNNFYEVTPLEECRVFRLARP